jgi:DNA-binding helix-hairpin-helix protein with protein kinase domain
LKDGTDIIGPTPEGVQLLLNDETSAFLNGVSTQNLVSGRRILPGLVIVRGSKQYTSVLGANRSAWLLDAISDSEWVKAQSLVERREATKRRNELRDELAEIFRQLDNLPEQSFTSANGQFSTVATITDFIDGAYVMRRNDGQEIRVEDAKLDDASQFAARQQMKRLVSAKRRITAIKKELGISSPFPLATSD